MTLGKMKRNDLIAGARPNFMKISPIIEAIKKSKAAAKLRA
jgi:UDP-N-acetylglucosamine 2-epimerase